MLGLRLFHVSKLGPREGTSLRIRPFLSYSPCTCLCVTSLYHFDTCNSLCWDTSGLVQGLHPATFRRRYLRRIPLAEYKTRISPVLSLISVIAGQNRRGPMFVACILAKCVNYAIIQLFKSPIYYQGLLLIRGYCILVESWLATTHYYPF